MIWFIIGLIAFIIITIWIFISKSFSKGYSIGEKLADSALMLVISFLCSLLVCLVVSGIISGCAEVNYKVVSDKKIIALKDNQNINGSFYIFGGYVDEDLYYYYAAETELGYKTEKIKASEVYIKYTDDEAHIERCQAEFVNEVVRIFGLPLQDDRYIIYCPEGTVTNEFNVDLE